MPPAIPGMPPVQGKMGSSYTMNGELGTLLVPASTPDMVAVLGVGRQVGGLMIVPCYWPPITAL